MKTKELKEMTLEELWELFPIVLTAHNPQWVAWADAEIATLSEMLASLSPTINHIGSTAIPGICAKPIIDILVEIPYGSDWSVLEPTLESAGYICMSVSEGRMSFNKGYTPTGFADKVFHIHIRRHGDNDELFFRDYLLAHHTTALEYEALKLSLLPEYRHDRDGYTAAKSNFIKRVTQLAKQESCESDK